MAEASAPASSANLGPGFDTVGLALEIRCRVVARRADGWSVRHHGEERPRPEAGDAVLDGARLAVGGDRPLALDVHNEVQVGKGLGSSAAAFAAGVLAAWRAVGESHPAERLFELVTEFEGHPDNAAATVYGGLVIATSRSVHRLPWNPRFRLVLAVPHDSYPTKEARLVLPEAYPSDVVVRTNARMGALVAGLLTGDEALLREAGGDEIHEAPRQRERPDVGGLVDVARNAGAAHAAWSGAGPSVIAFVVADRVEAVSRALRDRMGEGGSVSNPTLATRGAV